MSEIRRTQPVEVASVPPNENRLSLADVLAGIGRLAYQGGRLAVKGVVTGTKLTAKGIDAVREVSRQQAATQWTLPEASELVRTSSDARSALQTIAGEPSLDVPRSEAEQWKTRVESLAMSNDKLGVEELANELIRSRQDRLHTHVVAVTAESCDAIGFKPTVLRAANGLLTAKSADGKRKICIEVEKAKNGEIQLHFDADGFHGSGCTQALDALQDQLQERGVRFRIGSRRRKDRGPAVDATRLPRSQRNRS